MNNKLEVIGIDHGWSMMKTISQVFVTGVKEITTTPALFGDVLEYEGKFYKVGTVRQEVKDTKVEDDSFYLLTLAAVARELKRRGLAEAKVFLAVGLPLTRLGSNVLDLPDRPADMEQCNGRAVRKGNTVKLWVCNVVDIVIYGTEKTLDANKFNLLKNKHMFTNQINNGTIAVRRIDEDSMDEDIGMNFSEFVAIPSGNTDLLNKAELDNKIMQLEKEQAIFKKELSLIHILVLW